MAAGAGTGGASNYRSLAMQTAQQYGIPPDLFVRLIGAESGFNPNARSPVGARGLSQLMPATARALGVNPDDPIQNLDGGARYLQTQFKRFGSWEKALAAYNAGPNAVQRFGGIPPYAETQRYVRQILGGRGSIGAAASRASTGPSPAPDVQQAPALVSDQGRGEALDVLLSDPGATGSRQQAYLNAPIVGGKGGASPLRGLLRRLDSVQPQLVASGAPAPAARSAAAPSYAASASPPRGPSGPGTLIGRPLDRAGVETQPAILDFARRISGTLGRPIKLGTGTAHNRMTTTGNVSAHWDGNALDLPASGPALIQMGQAALIAAGMPPAQARKARGGVYNVGGYQILFNTGIGGNHYNHTHVGIRR